MEIDKKHESLKKLLLPIGLTVGILIIGGLIFYLLAVPFDIYVISKTYSYVVSRIINISGLNQWLVKGIVIIALIPLVWVLPHMYFGKRNTKKIARSIGLVYLAAFFFTLYSVSKDIYFAHSGKETLKWYALTPEGVRYYDSPGVDTIYGIPLQPVTPGVIRNLRLWENKSINLVDPQKATFFNPITGEPQVWYYYYPEGAFEFYDKPGYHPVTGEPLKAVTKQIYFEWKEKARTKEDSRKLNDFKSVINQNVVTYPDKPNVVMVIESLGTQGGISLENTLIRLLKKDKINFVDHYFREGFKAKGYFGEIYGGNTEILKQSGALSKIDYVIMGKINYTFKKQGQIDRDLVSCNISFTFKVINKNGDIVKSENINVVGPGFSEGAALERGLEIMVERYSDNLVKSVL